MYDIIPFIIVLKRHLQRLRTQRRPARSWKVHRLTGLRGTCGPSPFRLITSVIVTHTIVIILHHKHDHGHDVLSFRTHHHERHHDRPALSRTLSRSFIIASMIVIMTNITACQCCCFCYRCGCSFYDLWLHGHLSDCSKLPPPPPPPPLLLHYGPKLQLFS